MTSVSASVKRRRASPSHPKDWERRARVVSALSKRQITITELAEELEVSTAYVSAVIWGRRRLASAERSIAAALGKSWAELFAPDADRRAA